MFSNTIKTAVRNLLKNKGFTFLNVFGLALGLAICLLIVLYVIDEWSYDRYNDKADRIYRVDTDVKYGNTLLSFAQAGPPAAAALIREFPEVEKAVRLTASYGNRFKKGSEQVLEERGAFADPGIFGFFTLPMVEGDSSTALKEPNSIVLTETLAKKYFNREDVVGQIITIIDDSVAHVVTGVIRDMPQQSHFRFDFLLPMTSIASSRDLHFNVINYNTYILLKPGSAYKSLEAKFPAFLRRALASMPDGWDVSDFEKGGNYLKMNLTPLREIHLRSNRTREFGINGNIQYIYIFSAIALFILLVACINFVNLSTARSASRAREVGVRKVLGSSRGDLIARFLSESMMVTVVAMILAITAVWSLLPLFNRLSGKELSITWQTVTGLWPWALGIIGIVGLLAGAWPAFFLSAFQPVEVLKGHWRGGAKGGALRNFLVIFQFSVSIFLIIGTLVIYNQLKYIRDKDLGYNRDEVLVFGNIGLLKNPRMLKEQIMQLPGVAGATLSALSLTDAKRWPNFTSTGKVDLKVDFWPVDEDYLPVMGMKLVKGRNFSHELRTDSSAVILNEAAAHALGYAGDPLNKSLQFGADEKSYHIIGVVKDFNFNSLRERIAPLVLVVNKEQDLGKMLSLSIRVNTANMPVLLSGVERVWKFLSPDLQFEYSFMDEDFDALYRAEQRMGQLCIVFTSLAILIACLGLFGLAAYAAERRSRELAIRKVLGAEFAALIALLSKDFMKLIVLSILIATPLAWIVMHKWLQDFAYRVDIGWWVPAVAGVMAVVIAAVIISFQSIKAAHANPIESLRSE